jgi:hypothetical protein
VASHCYPLNFINHFYFVSSLHIELHLCFSLTDFGLSYREMYTIIIKSTDFGAGQHWFASQLLLKLGDFRQSLHVPISSSVKLV